MKSIGVTRGEASAQTTRKRVLVLLAWYATDVFRGIAVFARDAGWILDSSYERTGEVPEGWRGDGIIGVLGVDPEVDRLLDAARDAGDPVSRKSALRQAHQRIHDDAPMVFLWTLDSYAALSTHVRQVTVHPFTFFTWAPEWQMQ